MLSKNNSSVLVVFKNELPKKNEKWWRHLNIVIGPKKLRKKIEDAKIQFVDIEKFTDPGSVRQASRLADNLSRLVVSDGRRLPKIITYCGYELWWIHHNHLMHRFCLPYTQYRQLLEYLKTFSKVYLYQAPSFSLFQYFLTVHDSKCIIVSESKGSYHRFKKLFPIPPGILVQVILSAPFLLRLKFTRPKLMVWTSDRFTPPHRCDFRMIHIYEELRKRKISFVEFIRSQEDLITILQHAFLRKRPVIYSGAIISFLYYLGSYFGKEKKGELMKLCLSKEADRQKKFWFLVATHYLGNFTGTIWSIKAMKFILQWIGIKAAIIISPDSRTFHKIVGCKLAGIKTVGILHGVPQYFSISDFMPGFDGKLPLTQNMYGLWSDWWRDYYISHGQAFQPAQLYVSGFMRPLEREIVEKKDAKVKKKLPKVLFVLEQLAAPEEIMPYLLTLLGAEDISVFVKFRSYRDGFENWLKENQPDILEKVRILRGDIHDAISQCDVVVGSHSTAVLEALLQLKPPIFFQTAKWEDHFDMKSLGTQYCLFAENPKELINCIRKSAQVPEEVLKQLQNKFFGNPHQNGSKWVVDQAEKFLQA